MENHDVYEILFKRGYPEIGGKTLFKNQQSLSDAINLARTKDSNSDADKDYLSSISTYLSTQARPLTKNFSMLIKKAVEKQLAQLQFPKEKSSKLLKELDRALRYLYKEELRLEETQVTIEDMDFLKTLVAHQGKMDYKTFISFLNTHLKTKQ